MTHEWTFEERLVALHYLFPVPKNRLAFLLAEDPTLCHYHTYSVEKIAQLLRLSSTKASSLLKNLKNYEKTPYVELYKKHEITPIPFTHPYYPKSLLSLIDPPTVLYVKGNKELLLARYKIAIIGARKASVYSEEALTYIVPPLIKNDVVIVSGLAKGADTMAHNAAMMYGGKTIAVLGNGFFHHYPRENEMLANEIGKTQLLVTEYPPYVKPARWTFPMRNRIISGLCTGVIVTEAALKSGTMSTVEHALDHGKDVFAVPGSVTSTLSEGPNRLIDEGAKPLWNGYQVISILKNQMVE